MTFYHLAYMTWFLSILYFSFYTHTHTYMWLVCIHRGPVFTSISWFFASLVSLCFFFNRKLASPQPVFPSCRWAVHRWRWEEHVHQPAPADRLTRRLQGLPGVHGPEREAARPAGRCPPQGGGGGARLRRWESEDLSERELSSPLFLLVF